MQHSITSVAKKRRLDSLNSREECTVICERISSSKVYLWICLDLEPVVAKVTFHPEAENRGRKVVSDLFLFRVVAYTYQD